VNVRFYYTFLKPQEKRMFDSICAQLQVCQPEIHVTGSLQTARKILPFVLNDCPEFFYADNTRMQFVSGMGTVSIRMRYTKDASQIRAIRQRLDTIGRRFLAEVQKKQLNNQDTVRYVHDFILKNTEYAQESLDRQDLSGDVSNICGVFVNKRAVCKGIALAAKWLLDQAGIPSGVIEGRVIRPEIAGMQKYIGKDSQNDHAWNVVNVNDVWQYMDITMDLGASQDNKSWIAYDYFLRGDAAMAEYVQYRNPYIDCKTEKYSYFVRNRTIISGEEDLRKYLRYCMKNRKKRLYFQVEESLAQKDASAIETLVSRTVRSEFRWRYNQKLHIYDFMLM